MNTWHEARQNFYKKTFVENVCTKCTICKPPIDPRFCLILYARNKEDFWKKMQYIVGLRLTDQKKFEGLTTFSGFCGMFCNSIIPCPQRGEPCKNLAVKVSCYNSFTGQCGAKIAPEAQIQIYAIFSGIEEDAIGRDTYGISRLDPLKLIKDKKQRKKTRKTVKKMRKKLENALKLAGLYTTTDNRKSKITKRKKKVTTAFFYNDNDEEWKDQIDAYLAK
ncbi:hypothetical protein LCGC14_1781640 [marine sediment metagenome]|uniref:Uncharacterized protein n=1 Tax=marine sediment metagenome TaxID=412755 RepID=A0A0F9GVB1_9ZZZZ